MARTDYLQCLDLLRDAHVDVADSATAFLDQRNGHLLASALVALRQSKIGGRMVRVEAWQSEEDPEWQRLVVVLEAVGLTAAQKRDLRSVACRLLGEIAESKANASAEIVTAIYFRI